MTTMDEKARERFNKELEDLTEEEMRILIRIMKQELKKRKNKKK